MWVACLDCGKARWVALRKGIPVTKHCLSCSKKGERNAQWKGGQISDQGYIRIHQPKHHRATKAGYVQEHILVWEKTHNKPLPKGWVVHHYNGIRNDNRPSNLFGMASKKHSDYIPTLQKRIKELEALLKNQGQLI